MARVNQQTVCDLSRASSEFRQYARSPFDVVFVVLEAHRKTQVSVAD